MTSICIRPAPYRRRLTRRILFALLLGGSAFAPALTAQSGASGPAITLRAGAIRHELLGHTAIHPSFGTHATVARLSGVGIGLSADWWRDRIVVTPASGGEDVEADYFLYGLTADVAAGRIRAADAFVTGGIGAETVVFGDRGEASTFLPASSTGPQASLGLGGRIPLGGAGGRLSVRLDVRGHAAYMEVFDATGVEEGREIGFHPVASLGLTYAIP